MRQIENITNQANQQTKVILDDGSILTLEVFFNPATVRWTMNVSHDLLTVNEVNICNFPNLLRPWRNLVAFGLACITTTGQDPINSEDFTNGNAALYILDQADVDLVESDIMGGLLQ